jgi:hypothetical protein
MAYKLFVLVFVLKNSSALPNFFGAAAAKKYMARRHACRSCMAPAAKVAARRRGVDNSVTFVVFE